MDFTEKSLDVLEAVLLLSSTYGSRFTFLHVDEPVHKHAPGGHLLGEILRGASTVVAERFEALAGNELASVEAMLTRAEGVPHLEIVRQAREMDADLILISTHGVLGSVAQNVIREACCSVLTMRRKDE